MMTETEQMFALQAIDIKALRQADTVSFHLRKTGEGEIVCSKRVEGDPWEDEKRHTIRVCTRFEYGTATYCFAMIHSCRFHPQWVTAVSHIRAGDTLSLMWDVGGHNNDHVKEAGLTVDGVSLRVTRGEGKEQRQMTYGELCMSITPPGSSARMCQ